MRWAAVSTQMYLAGLGVKPSGQDALRWIQSAAAQGYQEAVLAMDGYAKHGNAFEKSDAATLRRAAERGDAQAQRKYADALYDGKGNVPLDLKQAVQWYLKAAQQDDLESQGKLALMYLWGAGVDKDPAEAMRWMLKAAGQGDPASQNNIAVSYFFGDTGLPKDYRQAAFWFRKAYENGQKTLSPYYLGQMYAEGNGVGKDPQEAVRWMRIAAEQNFIWAQIKLGEFYEQGVGVVPDPQQAKQWYAKAMRQAEVEDSQEAFSKARQKLAGLSK